MLTLTRNLSPMPVFHGSNQLFVGVGGGVARHRYAGGAHLRRGLRVLLQLRWRRGKEKHVWDG